MKKVFLIVGMVSLLLNLTACQGQQKTESAVKAKTNTAKATQTANQKIDLNANPKTENKGDCACKPPKK